LEESLREGYPQSAAFSTCSLKQLQQHALLQFASSFTILLGVNSNIVLSAILDLILLNQ